MTAHAFLSPSGAPAWVRCPAKPVREADLPDTAGKDAAEGTAAHELRAMCLTSGKDARAYLGAIIDVDGQEFVVDEDMADHVQKTIDVLRQFTGQMLVEQRLPIHTITGEEGAHGTADTVILDADNRRLIIDDLKYGKGVPVYAEENEQLLIYAGAALAEYEVIGDFDTVTMRISQPRINNDSEWTITRQELIARLVDIRATAEKILCSPDDVQANPGEKQCKFCRAKGICPELRAHVMATVADDFVDLNKDVAPQLSAAVERIQNSDNVHLANCLSAVDLIEDWCKAVRAKAEAELLEGHDVPGYKLVEGRRGARKWSDASVVEAAMKSMRLKVDDMYDMTLISPTSAEKLVKSGTIGQRQWTKLQEHVTQPTGKPSVVPASDKRQALKVGVSADDFDVVEG